MYLKVRIINVEEIKRQLDAKENIKGKRKKKTYQMMKMTPSQWLTLIFWMISLFMKVSMQKDLTCQYFMTTPLENIMLYITPI